LFTVFFIVVEPAEMTLNPKLVETVEEVVVLMIPVTFAVFVYNPPEPATLARNTRVPIPPVGKE